MTNNSPRVAHYVVTHEQHLKMVKPESPYIIDIVEDQEQVAAYVQRLLAKGAGVFFLDDPSNPVALEKKDDST